MQNWPFISGRLYNRRADIHAPFGGQQQGGIASPAKHNVVFAFTGKSGAKHGYSDSYQSDGSFHYYGEGQQGDMRIQRGNLAIASHAGLSRDLLLFETTNKGGPVRYIGQFVCAGWFSEQQPDTNGDLRQAIVFKLVPLAAFQAAIEDSVPEGAADDAAFNALRMRAYAAASMPVKVTKEAAVTSAFVRSRIVRDYALARANGACECCGKAAPFTTVLGQPFLEVHHIRRLTDGGPDSPNDVAAICPNCHREAHHGAGAERLNASLLETVRAVERVTYADLKHLPAFAVR